MAKDAEKEPMTVVVIGGGDEFTEMVRRRWGNNAVITAAPSIRGDEDDIANEEPYPEPNPPLTGDAVERWVS